MGNPHGRWFRGSVALAGAFLAGLPLAAQVKPPAEPAKVRVSIDPQVVAAGERTEVTVALDPMEGVRIARYPGVKVRIDGQAGLVAEQQLVAGDTKPPAPDALDRNYFDRLEPLRLSLQLEAGAPPGRHELGGEVTYAYCIPSGLCSRAKVPLTFPIQVTVPHASR
jgi:hypothetical protein